MEKILTKLGFFICLLIILYVTFNTIRITNSIEGNKFMTTGKVIYYTSKKGNTIYRYVYNYRYKRYENNSYKGDGQEEGSVNKFYVLKISTENPAYSEIDLDQEVTDTVEIIKAGFTKEDIKN